MKWDALEEEPCSLARTVAVIGDRWSLLILRECFLRTRRFEGFQSALGITRHLLAERLKKLVRQGILRRIPYQESPKRHEYILTQKGLDLYPIMMAIVHWGDTHMVDTRGRPLLHQHRKCGKNFDPVMVCSECGERHLVGRGEIVPAVEGEAIDVPRVPLVGVVGVELQEVAAAAGCQHFTADLLVPHRGEQPV